MMTKRNRKKFFERYMDFMRIAIALSDKTRQEGLLALGSEIEDIDDEFFKKGLRLVHDGVAAAYIDEILSARIAHEKNKDERLLKTITKRAVLGIQAGEGFRVFYEVLNAYAGTSEKEEWILLDLLDDGEDEEEQKKPVLTPDEVDAIFKQIKEGDFTFNDITLLSGDVVKLLVNELEVQRNNLDDLEKDIDNDILIARAVKNATEEARKKIFANLMEGQGEIVEDFMQARIDDKRAQKAQDYIVAILKRMVGYGDIVITTNKE